MKFNVHMPRPPSKEVIKERLTSVEAWKLPKHSSSIAADDVWTNADQDPVPPEKRTWGPWAFVGYWFSDLVTVSTWEVGSSILDVGLGTRDAFLILLVAGISNMIPTVLNGAIGSKHHVPFPIAVRASFGYWFAYFAVVSRGVLAAFWLGVQSVGGGSAVTQALIAIWPSYMNIPNHLPASADITTRDMCSYLIFHIIQLPFLLVPTHRLQNLFLLKSILMPPLAIGMLAWVCVKAGGAGAILHQPATLTGSTYAWTWLATATSVTGGYSTLAVNIPDFSRFSKSDSAQWWQGICIPILKIVTAAFGIISTGACRVAFGEDFDAWNPLNIVALWTGSGGRFMAFVCSALWILAQISCNVSANSFSFANDLTSLFPKWINIKRGTVICSIIGGWLLVPWIMDSSAIQFLEFMSGYAIFLAPMAGILTCDYWIIRRCKLDVPSLYNPHGRYRYNYGVNWRALVVMVVIIVPMLPGLGEAVTPNAVKISIGAVHLYNISWLYGYHASIFLYWLLWTISPAKETLVTTTIPGIPDLIEGTEIDDSATSTAGEETVEVKGGFKSTEIGL